MKSRILIIDDDCELAELLGNALRALAAVTIRYDAESALQLFQPGQNPEAFDFIFCDLNMPGASGIDFLTRLQAIQPDQCDKVIFLSGGAISRHDNNFLLHTKNRYIEKPFRISEIRQLLA